jgi:hypothetical protein
VSKLVFSVFNNSINKYRTDHGNSK